MLIGLTWVFCTITSSRGQEHKNTAFATAFEGWFSLTENEIFQEMSDFISDNRSRSDFEANMQTALLSCTSGGKLSTSSSYYDHRHMFRVETQKNKATAFFVASPFLPAFWRPNSLAKGVVNGAGVCTSGISLSVALKLLRTKFNAGALPCFRSIAS